MARPGANIFLSNGNLGIPSEGSFGTPVVAMAIPIAPTAGYGVPFSVKSKKQVLLAFADAGNAAVVTAINDYFYGECPEGKELFIIAVVNTTALDALATETVIGKALDYANGKGRVAAFVKFPAGSYVSTPVTGFDADVHLCVTAAQTLCNSWLAKHRPFRSFVEGYGFVSTATAKDYSTDTKRNCFVINGNAADSTANALFLALGRVSKEQSQRNIGRVKSGSLAIAENVPVKIGSILVDKMASVDLDTLHTKRYITFERNEVAPGYIFNDDNALTDPTDDYNNLRNGLVMDNAVRIAYTSFYEELKDDVDVDAGGRLKPVVEKALETKIESAISQQLRGQLATNTDGSVAVEALVNPDPVEYPHLYAQNDIANPNFNILQTNLVYIFVQLRPKGCLKYINVFLGYTVN